MQRSISLNLLLTILGVLFMSVNSPLRADILATTWHYPNASSSGAILRYQEGTGAYLGVFATGLIEPSGITFGPDGKLYVCTLNGAGVYKGTFEGGPVYTEGSVLRYFADGTLDETFFTSDDSLDATRPQNITFGAEGIAYISCGSVGYGVDVSGNTINTYRGNAALGTTNAVLVPNRYVYFGDPTGEIRQLSQTGVISSLFNDGLSGGASGQGLASDSLGNLYASSQDGWVFTYKAPLSSATVPNYFANVAAESVGGEPPVGLCFDRNGDLIAGGLYSLTRVHPDGSIGAPFGGPGLSVGDWVALSPDPSKLPTLSSVTPGTVTSGTGDTSVKLSGGNFLPASQVYYTTSTTTTLFTPTYVNANTLTIVIPKTMLAYANTATITVSNYLAGGGASNGRPFTVIGMPHLTVSAITKGDALYYTIHNVGDVDADNLVIQNLFDGNYGWYMFPGYPYVTFLPIVPSFTLPAGTSISFPNPVYFPNIFNQPPNGIQILQVYGTVNAFGESKSLNYTLSTVFFFGGS